MENKVWPGEAAGDKPGMACGLHTVTGVFQEGKLPWLINFGNGFISQLTPYPANARCYLQRYTTFWEPASLIWRQRGLFKQTDHQEIVLPSGDSGHVSRSSQRPPWNTGLCDLFILNPPLHFVFTACIWRQPSETGIDQKRQVSGKTTNLGVEIRNFPREQN